MDPTWSNQLCHVQNVQIHHVGLQKVKLRKIWRKTLARIGLKIRVPCWCCIPWTDRMIRCTWILNCERTTFWCSYTFGGLKRNLKLFDDKIRWVITGRFGDHVLIHYRLRLWQHILKCSVECVPKPWHVQKSSPRDLQSSVGQRWQRENARRRFSRPYIPRWVFNPWESSMLSEFAGIQGRSSREDPRAHHFKDSI